MFTPTSIPVARQQSLRLTRFFIASGTYVLGFVFVALCSAIGLYPADRLLHAALIFVLPNLLFLLIFTGGYNLRFSDPSLTQAQVCAAASTVTPILAMGEGIHFLAVPFYSSLFVFAMLQMKLRALLRTVAFVITTYALTLVLRARAFPALDLRLEAVHAALVLLSLGWFALAAGYIGRLRTRLRESVHTIEQLATRDALTDSWNRRHIDTLLNDELQRTTRLGGPVCVVLLDLDHFKSINDRFGHLAGDAVLAAAAASLKAQLRGIDAVGRFGGEEFLVVLPGTNLREARVCAERLRVAVTALGLPEHPGLGVSLSAGVAEAAPGETAPQLLARADAALYRAKAAGRNRVEPALSLAAPSPSATGRAANPAVETNAD